MTVSSDGDGGYHIQRQDGDGTWSDVNAGNKDPNENHGPRPCKPLSNCPGNLCAPNNPPVFKLFSI
jgi:hypothetical protein